MDGFVPTTGTVSDLASMRRIDEVELRILRLHGEVSPSLGGTIESCPVTHHFTPGLYCREIFMPKDMVITSRVHRYRHPFVVSQGKCMVYMGGQGEESWTPISAPHFGITEPGTRRVLVILEDTVWTTFHVTNETDVEKIAADILVPYENPLLKEVTQ